MCSQKRDKKPSKPKSKPTWKCEDPKCKHTGNTPCPHLEALLPSMDEGLNMYVPDRVQSKNAKGRHRPLKYQESLSMYAAENTLEAMQNEITQINDFVECLFKFALSRAEVSVLCARFVEGKTYAEIGKALGTSATIAYRTYHQALDKITLHFEQGGL